MENINNIQATINTNSYFNEDREICLEFNCSNGLDKIKIKKIIEDELLPSLGPTSFIASCGYDTIIPYYLDTNNELTYVRTNNLSFIVIPYYLINCIFKKLVEKYNIDIFFKDLVFSSSYTKLDREILFDTLYEKNKLSKCIKCSEK